MRKWQKGLKRAVGLRSCVCVDNLSSAWKIAVQNNCFSCGVIIESLCRQNCVFVFFYLKKNRNICPLSERPSTFDLSIWEGIKGASCRNIVNEADKDFEDLEVGAQCSEEGLSAMPHPWCRIKSLWGSRYDGLFEQVYDFGLDTLDPQVNIKRIDLRCECWCAPNKPIWTNSHLWKTK